MSETLAHVWRDTLVRFQRTAIRETGCRPVAWLRTPMEEALLLPGCCRAGCSFWQPAPWPQDGAPLGKKAGSFHESIIEYLSMCQFLEMRFQLPVARRGSTLSFLYRRTFEMAPNTRCNPPSRAFEEAFLYQREHPSMPLAYCMAATCDGGKPLLLMLRAADGQAFVQHAEGGAPILEFRLGLDRLLPKLQFVYDI